LSNKSLSSLLVLFAVVWAPVSLQAQCDAGEILVPADRDNTLYEEAAGALSNGAGSHFFVGRVAPPQMQLARRGLIHFDVAGVLPPDGTVLASVRLVLNMSRTTAFDEIVSLHSALADWGEGGSVAPGQEGGGAPSQAGDATWIHTFFDTTLWTSAGGDFVSGASAAVEIEDVGVYSWGSTPEMVADVQGWIDDPSSNFGWMLIGNENSASTAKRFDSRENQDPSVNPALCLGTMPPPVIEIPTLGGIGLALLALLLVGIGLRASTRFKTSAP
jgi:hypothetical protein